MKEITNDAWRLETYSADDGYMVDIQEVCCLDKDEYEAWLYHQDYGIKTLMFAMPVEQQSLEEFVEIVERNVDGHKALYNDLYVR